MSHPPTAPIIYRLSCFDCHLTIAASPLTSGGARRRQHLVARADFGRRQEPGRAADAVLPVRRQTAAAGRAHRGLPQAAGGAAPDVDARQSGGRHPDSRQTLRWSVGVAEKNKKDVTIANYRFCASQLSLCFPVSPAYKYRCALFLRVLFSPVTDLFLPFSSFL